MGIGSKEEHASDEDGYRILAPPMPSSKGGELTHYLFVVSLTLVQESFLPNMPAL